jgi:hypothetical protein
MPNPFVESIRLVVRVAETGGLRVALIGGFCGLLQADRNRFSRPRTGDARAWVVRARACSWPVVRRASRSARPRSLVGETFVPSRVDENMANDSGQVPDRPCCGYGIRERPYEVAPDWTAPTDGRMCSRCSTGRSSPVTNASQTAESMRVPSVGRRFTRRPAFAEPLVSQSPVALSCSFCPPSSIFSPIFCMPLSIF